MKPLPFKVYPTNLGIILGFFMISLMGLGIIIDNDFLFLLGALLPILFVLFFYDIIAHTSNFKNIIELNKAIKQNRVKITGVSEEEIDDIDILDLDIDGKEYELWLCKSFKKHNYTLSEKNKDTRNIIYIDLFSFSPIVKKLKEKTLKEISKLDID